MENFYDTSKKPNEKGFVKKRKGLKFYPASQSESYQVMFNSRENQDVELTQLLTLFLYPSKQEKPKHI